MRTFPLNYGYGTEKVPPKTITWEAAEKAYATYSKRHGTKQSLERLAERGGFSASELDDLYPEWKSHIVDCSHDYRVIECFRGVDTLRCSWCGRMVERECNFDDDYA